MQSENKGATPEIIWGARGIAKIIGKSERATYHMISKRLLPVKRVGGQLCAIRSELLRALSSEAA